jgi:hypothetical protein
MRTLLIFILFCNLSSLAQVNSSLVPDTVFYNIYGGPNQEEAKDFIETNDKGFLICGSSSSFGQGTSSVYLIKTDSTGIFKWSRTYGGINVDKGMSIVKTPDNGAFISGYSNSFNNFEYDAYCIKIDSIGTLEWQKSYVGNDWDFIYSSALMPDSGLVMAGETYTNSAGDADAYLIRINKYGDTLWTKKFGTPLMEKFNSVVYAENSIYVCGTIKDALTLKTKGLIARYSLSGNLLSSNYIFGNNQYEYGLNCINKTQNHQFVLAGDLIKADSILPHGEIRIRIDSSLNLIWRDTSSFFATLSGRYIFQDNRQHIMTVLTLNGGNGKTAMFLADYDDWVYYNFGSTYGGVEDEEGVKGMISSRNKLVYLGNTYSWGYGDKDYWLVMFKADTLIGDQKIKFYTQTDTTSLSPFDLKEYSLLSLSVFPNPINKNEKIIITNINPGESITIELTDINGQLIFKQEHINLESLKIELNKFNLATGVYYVRFIQDDKVKVTPLIITD